MFSFGFRVSTSKFQVSSSCLETRNLKLETLNSDRFSIIHRLLALFERHVRLLPGWLATFVPTAARHFAEIVRRTHLINLNLKNRLDRALDLRFGRPAIDAKRQQLATILRLFFRHQRLLSDYRRFDNIPNSSHGLLKLQISNRRSKTSRLFSSTMAAASSVHPEPRRAGTLLHHPSPWA